MSNRITIYVNDKPIQTVEGALLIDVLIENNINIAYFCYHKALGADGNCRMCMVQIEGQKRPQISCDTFTKAGMKVYTQSESIVEVKKNILELELLNHPVDCPICDQAGECKLQDYYMEYGLYDSRVNTEKNHKNKAVDLGSNVMLDQERCVLCARCTRFTQDVTKTAELAIIGRGDHARVSTAPNKKLSNPYAMNVIDLCPVGALTSKDFRFKKRVWFLDSVESICHGCSHGCNIYVDHNQNKYEKDKIYRFRPRVNIEVNGYFICDEGRLSYTKENNLLELEYSNKHGALYESEAISLYKKALQNAQKTLVLVSPSLSLEELSELKKYAARLNAEIFSLAYNDENFGDDFLRKNEKSANLEGVKALDICYDINAFEEAKKSADLIINFDNNSLGDFENSVISFTPYSSEEDALLKVKYSSFTHTSGTLLNYEKKAQRYFKSIHTDGISLLEKLKLFDSSVLSDEKEIWQENDLENITHTTLESLNKRLKHA